MSMTERDCFMESNPQFAEVIRRADIAIDLERAFRIQRIARAFSSSIESLAAEDFESSVIQDAAGELFNAIDTAVAKYGSVLESEGIA